MVVACPCPCVGKLTEHLAVPSGSTATVAASIPGTSVIPRSRKIVEPIPVYSV